MLSLGYSVMYIIGRLTNLNKLFTLIQIIVQWKSNIIFGWWCCLVRYSLLPIIVDIDIVVDFDIDDIYIYIYIFIYTYIYIHTYIYIYIYIWYLYRLFLQLTGDDPPAMCRNGEASASSMGTTSRSSRMPWPRWRTKPWRPRCLGPPEPFFSGASINVDHLIWT